MIPQNIEIISLIFKSVEYLDFIIEQLRSVHCQTPGWDVGVRIVANDATPEVLDALRRSGINHTSYNDPHPDAYYLNRVYRAWNFAGRTSAYDNICFVNSDGAFSEGWLSNMLKHHDGVNIPCSMFYESGKMPSGWPGLTKDFGRSPAQFKGVDWEAFAKSVQEDRFVEGGLYMPYAMTKKRFLESGGYPEGNVYTDGVGTQSGIPNLIATGDQFFFNHLKTAFGMKHITVMDSLYYHIQEGEKDS